MVKNIRPNNTCTLINNSKRLRRNLTEEESILWFHLRKKYAHSSNKCNFFSRC
ncbi:hypothetical protein O1Q81_01147 [Lonepinella sp. MS14436]